MNTLALVTSALALVAAATGCTATAVDSSSTEPSAIRIDDKSLATSETVLVDLTGTNVYEIAVSATARDRVVVHNAQADRKLPEYLQQLGVSPSIDAKVIRLSGDAKKLTSTDVAAPAPEQKLIAVGGGSKLSFTCSPFSCACTGDVDCNDMFEGGVCGGDAICIDDSCYCFRWGRALR